MLRFVASVAVAVTLTSCKARPAEAEASHAAPEVELVLKSGPAKLDAAATLALVKHVERALAICNFTSTARPEIFGGADLEALWKERGRGAHLRVRYPTAKRIDAVAGKLELSEVLLSVGRPDGPEPALMRGVRGVVGLKMCGYDDRFLGCDAELAPLFPKPASCPPGF
jgi:hypothetical protein